MRLYLIEHYGDIASVAGLVISIVGFVVTIIGVGKARRAAEEARKAARLAVSRVGARMISDEITATIQLVKFVEQAVRESQWTNIVSWSVEVKTRIVNILDSTVVTAVDHDILLEIISDFNALIRRVEKPENKRKLTAPMLKRLSDVPVTLAKLRSDLRSKMEI